MSDLDGRAQRGEGGVEHGAVGRVELQPRRAHRAAGEAERVLGALEELDELRLALAAAERVLKPGGFAYVSTHQTFPLHG